MSKILIAIFSAILTLIASACIATTEILLILFMFTVFFGTTDTLLNYESKE